MVGGGEFDKEKSSVSLRSERLEKDDQILEGRSENL